MIAEIEANILNIIKANLDDKIIPTISMDKRFSSIGVGSIALLNIVVALESFYNIEFEDDKLVFSAFPTVQSLVDYVKFMISK